MLIRCQTCGVLYDEERASRVCRHRRVGAISEKLAREIIDSVEKAVCEQSGSGGAEQGAC
jgi:hypothetical protein